MKIPEITIQGWHHDGPVYRIHRKLTGWRNRKARRAGTEDFDQVGHPGGRNVEEPAVFMAYAHGSDEVYALNRGYVYEVEQLVDGDVNRILVDARDDYALHAFKDGLEFLGARALEDHELAELLELAEGGDVEDVEPEQPSNISDGAEAQTPTGEPLTGDEQAQLDENVAKQQQNRDDLAAAGVEPYASQTTEVIENEAGEQRAVEPEPLETPAVPEDVQNVSPSGQIGVMDLGGDVPPTPNPLAELTDAEVDAIDTAADDAIEDQRELKALAAELGVELEELEALSPEERAELADEGSTETAPEGTPEAPAEDAGTEHDGPATDDVDSEGDEDVADEEE